MADVTQKHIDIADQSPVYQLWKDVGSSQHVPGVMLVGPAGAALGVAEDAAHASGDPGIMSLGVRKDTPTALAGADGDYAPLEIDSAGRLWVRLPGSDVANSVQKVAELNTVTSAPITADGLVCPAGVGVIVRFYVSNTHATETATVQLYDNTAASGTKIGGVITVPPVNGYREVVMFFPYAIGVYADVTLGTVSMWAGYRGVL